MGQQLKQDRPLQVLIVDDEPDIRAELEAGLEMSGYLVSSVTNYAQAHERLVALWENGERLPDVVILDVRLSDGDGLHLLNDIRQLWPGQQHRPAVLCFSGDYSAAAIDRALAGGAAGFMSKPVSLEELRLSIDKAVQISVSGSGDA